MKKSMLSLLVILNIMPSSYSMERDSYEGPPQTVSTSPIKCLPIDIVMLIVVQVANQHTLDATIEHIKIMKFTSKVFCRAVQTPLFIIAVIDDYAQKFHLMPKAVALQVLRKLYLNEAQKQELLKKYEIPHYPFNKALDGELIGATKNGELDKIRGLLQQHADPNAYDAHGTTALMWAMPYCHDLKAQNAKEIVELLIKAGADVNAQDTKGQTALNLTLTFNLPEITTLLYSAGAYSNTVYTRSTFIGIH